MRHVSQIAAGVKPGHDWATAPEPASRIPQIASLGDLEITHPRVAQAIDAARAWQARRQDGTPEASLILCGPYGTGKTHIARAILWTIRYLPEEMDGKPVAPCGRFFTANDLLDRLGTSRDNVTGITTVARASDVIGNVPLVVIDDAGSSQQFPFVAADAQEDERHARWFKAIDYCYTYRIGVIMTTNLTPVALAAHLGGRSWDRLGEMAPRGFIVDMTGVASWRQKVSGR